MELESANARSHHLSFFVDYHEYSFSIIFSMHVADVYFQVVAHIHHEVGTILNLIVQKLPKRTMRLSRIIWLCSLLTTLLVETRYILSKNHST